MFLRALLDHVPHTLPNDHTRQWRIRAREALRDGDQVRLHTVVLRAHLRPEPAEAAHHFIGDQQDVVLFQHLLDRCPVALRRSDDAARSHHRLTNERSNSVGTLTRDQLFQFIHAIRDELRFVHADGRLPIPVRTDGMLHAIERQIEVLMEARQTRQAAGNDARTVITALA